MTESILQIRDLKFGYDRKELVLDGLNINVPSGSIYGFLGANGAGKTTTLKLILNLINTYKGTITVEGKDISKHYPSYLKKIGSLIETPSVYGHLSALDNLKIWANYFKVDDSRIMEVLDLMDLGSAIHKKTEQFSTGMKQRLGIGTALLHDPDILLLDEPTNGLDPMGILALRKTLNQLKDKGKTILISSHILPEVERMVTHVGLLKNGQMIFEDEISQLQSMKDSMTKLLLTVANSSEAALALANYTHEVISSNVLKISLTEKNDVPRILKHLVENQFEIFEAKQQIQDLESFFLSASINDKDD